MAGGNGYMAGVYQFTAAAAYSKGDFFCKGDWSGQVIDDYASGELMAVQTAGQVEVPKSAATLAVALGDALYSTDNEATVNKTSASRKLVGYAMAASPNGTLNVMLDLVKGKA